MKLDRVIVKASDYRKSFAFYHDILGLRLKTSWQRADSWGALFFCGDVMLEIIWFPQGEGNVDCNYIPEHSKTELFISVSNVDSIYHKLSTSEGLELTQPKDKPWGYRLFSIYDPDHIKLVFSQPL